MANGRNCDSGSRRNPPGDILFFVTNTDYRFVFILRLSQQHICLGKKPWVSTIADLTWLSLACIVRILYSATVSSEMNVFEHE
jgi:hypothetical protein